MTPRLLSALFVLSLLFAGAHDVSAQRVVPVDGGTPNAGGNVNGGTPNATLNTNGGTPNAGSNVNGGTPNAGNNVDGGTPNTGGGNCDGKTLCNPLKVDSLSGLLDLLLSAAIQIGSIILVLALIWSGFLFVAARGNEEKIRSARTALMWTVIGGLILLGAKGIEEVIKSTVSTL